MRWKGHVGGGQLRIWKEVVMVCVIPRHSSGISEGNYKKLKPG
jgi:hypothetical protein